MNTMSGSYETVLGGIFNTWRIQLRNGGTFKPASVLTLKWDFFEMKTQTQEEYALIMKSVIEKQKKWMF